MGARGDERPGYRRKSRERFDGKCDRCGRGLSWGEVEVHHVDRDRSNDNDDNLENLCHGCHAEEHHGDDPLWRVVCSMPRPVLELLDEAVERNGYASRSEAVARAVVSEYEAESSYFGGPEESVVCWFGDDRHQRWVSDAVVRPPKSEEQDDA